MIESSWFWPGAEAPTDAGEPANPSGPTKLETQANEAITSVAIMSANCSQWLTAPPSGRLAPLLANSPFP